MIVSFDLDDTLFVSPQTHETEPVPPFPYKLLYRERLRKGTCALFGALRQRGAQIWIYTTSERSERYIRGLFRSYGLALDTVINGLRHAREVQRDRQEALPSKYPAHYRIALHVDDDVSVMQNGQRYGFRVFLVGAQDAQWTEKLLDCIQKMEIYSKQLQDH